jgi:hypothetical protein
MLLIFSITPFLGLLIEYLFTRTTRLCILVVAGLLSMPLLMDYEYFIRNLITLPELIFFAGIYSLLFSLDFKKSAKVMSTVSLTVALVLVLGYATFISEMGGSQTVERRWEKNEYRIEYIVDQGFAGHELRKYELRKYSFIPLFIKKVEIVRDTCSNNCCFVDFSEQHIRFNSCTGELKSQTTK